MDNRPKVGVGVIVLKDGKVLFGKRKNAHGAGTWSLPGGHLEFNESIEDAARREVMEETGLTISDLRRGPYTEDIFTTEGKHYITLYMIANFAGGEVRVMEPDKCERWDWFTWDGMPSPLFIPMENLLRQGFYP